MDLDTKNLKPFVWKKKLEEKGIDIDEAEAEKEARRRQELYRAELEAVRERRARLEFEYEQKRKDSEFLQRQREAEKYQHWEQQEDNFVLRQRRTRSKIRIRDGRPKPIDLFVYYIIVFGDRTLEDQGKLFIKEEEVDLSDSHIELLDPCDWFNGLRIADLEALIPEMKLCLEADPKPNRSYWSDLLTIAEDELSKLRRAKQVAENSIGDDDCLQPVERDIAALFENKSLRELEKLARSIEVILDDSNPSTDHHFYETALAKLRAHSARVRLGQTHKENLKRHANKIINTDPKKEQSPTIGSPKDEHKTDSQMETSPQPGTSQEDTQDVKDSAQLTGDPEDEVALCLSEYEAGRYSPQKTSLSQIEPGATVVEHESDYALLERQRKEIMHATTLDRARLATMSVEDRAFIEDASRRMDKDEVLLRREEQVIGHDNKAPVYSWADKYKPRKPRYLNRVHTGFEWNKYNQTHYDVDNPPPKVVQGYKFNIFYPDLIDKHKTPTYTLTPCKDNKDFTVIRFSAGPPYEDIAFRIVNREWDNSSKNGFKCEFKDNRLALYFRFKRLRYRR